MNCLILAPHQDDEIILCGSFIGNLNNRGYEIYVVFMTNGDYDAGIGRIRLREAIEALKIYDITGDHIIFMGYSNEYDARDPHIYNAPKGQIMHSKYGNAVTYGLPEHPEYCYIRHGIHHDYTRENLYTDLYEILGEIHPALIFVTGEEVHPDHSANSLLFDEVLGNMMRRDTGYHPVVLKKPEYHTAWIGAEDFTKENNLSAKFDYRTPKAVVNGAYSWFFDPYLRWHERIRIPVDLDAVQRVKKALEMYHSQNAIAHFSMLMNSDVVFWHRRTDSITYAANITVTSGNAGYLNDFKRNDSADIRRKDSEIWHQDESMWRPIDGDDAPEITIRFDGHYEINQVIIYQEYNPKSIVSDCSVIADGIGEIWRDSLCRFGKTKISFAAVTSDAVHIRINACSDKMTDIGISEVEVYSVAHEYEEMIKIMVNDQFVYEYVVIPNVRQKISIYSVSSIGEPRNRIPKEYVVEIYDEKGASVPLEQVIDNNWNIIPMAFDEQSLLVRVIGESGLSDQITIKYPKVEKKARIFFVGTPNHWNSGDHFIAQATIDYLTHHFPEHGIVEIQVNDFEQKFQQLKKIVNQYDIFVMQGGGNMGNVYPVNEEIRRKIITTFSRNCIVVFPETIYYENTAIGQYELLSSKKIYSDAEKLVLCARESKSYELMRCYYPNSRVVLVPDIVCSMNMDIALERERDGASLFFRNDGEKAISNDTSETIIRELKSRNISYSYRDMIYHHNKGYSGKANRKAIIRTKLLEIKGSRLVITDRLHAMILCVMTGTPCIVVHGYNHKIPDTYKTWFQNVPYVQLISEPRDIGFAIDHVVNAKADTEKIVTELEKHFDELTNVIKGVFDYEKVD